MNLVHWLFISIYCTFINLFPFVCSNNFKRSWKPLTQQSLIIFAVWSQTLWTVLRNLRVRVSCISYAVGLELPYLFTAGSFVYIDMQICVFVHAFVSVCILCLSFFLYLFLFWTVNSTVISVVVHVIVGSTWFCHMHDCHIKLFQSPPIFSYRV